MAVELSLTSTFASLQRVRQSSSASIFKLTPGQIQPPSADDDAVKKALSKGGQALSEEASRAAAAVNLGAFGSFLNAIDSLSVKIQEIDRKISKGEVRGDLISGYQKEREALTGELSRISSGPDSTLEGLRKAVSSTLARLEGGESSYGTFDPDVGFPGNAFGTLAATGQISSLRAIEGALNNISGLFSDGVLASGELGSISSSTKSIRSALYSPAGLPASVQQTASSGPAFNLAEPLQLQELSFESASGLALGLRTSTGENLLKAAALGVDFDARKSLVILLNEDEEKRPNTKTEITPIATDK